MAHGHRRRLQTEFEPDVDLLAPTAFDVDAALAEILAPPSTQISYEGPIGVVRTEYPVGYHHYPRFETDEEAEDARLARAWNPDDRRVQRLLQPGDPDGPPVRLTGRSSGGGRRRPKPVAIDTENAGGFGGGEQLLSETRFRVYGLTRGEAAFYFNRRGEAREKLRETAALLKVEGRRADASAGLVRPGKTKQPLNFDIYGLSREQIVILRAFPGVALEALVAYAHSEAHAEIAARDATNVAA